MAGQLDNKYGDRDNKPLTGVAAPTSETKASYTIQTALKLEAKALGTLGNAVTVKAEANTSDNLAVSVTGNAITIQLANTTGSKNTMTLIAAAIKASTPANALVNAIVITGVTQMTAFTEQSLSGGLNGNVGYLGEVRFDTDKNRWEMIYTISNCYYWALPIDSYPALNTEYLAYIENDVPVYKKKITGITNATAGTQGVIAHGIAFSSVPNIIRGIWTVKTTTNTYIGYDSSSFYIGGSFDQTNVCPRTGTNALLASRPFTVEIVFTK